ncbi:MAG: GNAT family N-acetyltransferase [Candidatus Thorarchaeota archaeon]
MEIGMRDFHWDTDFESVRNFLIEAWNAGPLYRNFVPTMMENVKFGPGGTEYLDEEDEYVKIWEIQSASISKIVAVSIVKPSGECWINIHPEHLKIERTIIQWIEEQRRELKEDHAAKGSYYFVVEDDDSKRISLLQGLGFQKAELEGVSRVRPANLPVPKYEVAEGYTIRHTDIHTEYEEYRTVQKAVFPHIKSMSKDQLEAFSTASFYVPELDIVAVDSNGVFAAFCTGRLDPVSRIAELEPVGTHPDHRKKGLAKATILECLSRLEKYNPVVVVILGAAATEGANRLYDSVGFENKGERHLWRKDV